LCSFPVNNSSHQILTYFFSFISIVIFANQDQKYFVSPTIGQLLKGHNVQGMFSE
jgi:hypothetical protein